MLAGPEVRKGVIEMHAYLEERAGDAAIQLAGRLDKLSVSSTTAAPNGTSQPSEESDETVEQMLGVRTPLTFMEHPCATPIHLATLATKALCIDEIL